VVNAYGRSLTVVLRHSFHYTSCSDCDDRSERVFVCACFRRGSSQRRIRDGLNGNIQADQDTSFQQMDEILKQFCRHP